MLENRKHPRFTPLGLPALITIVPPEPQAKFSLQGVVLDLSLSGIRIKLTSALPADLPESTIKITVTNPGSGIPITINGVIRHINSNSEWGLEFSKARQNTKVDELIFECIKLTTKTAQIKRS